MWPRNFVTTPVQSFFFPPRSCHRQTRCRDWREQCDVPDAGQFEELALDLGGDLSGEGTALRCEGHLHVNACVVGLCNGFETNAINEAEVDDIAGEFGVVTLFELRKNLLLGEAHDAFAS